MQVFLIINELHFFSFFHLIFFVKRIKLLNENHSHCSHAAGFTFISLPREHSHTDSTSQKVYPDMKVEIGHASISRRLIFIRIWWGAIKGG
jgi:hypothetical protein